MSLRAPLADCRRIVVKLGTHVVTHHGQRVALGRLVSVIEELATLRGEGRELLLVTSGAVAMGAHALGLPERPRSLGLRQACAAVGQGELMALYARSFEQLGVKVAQVLLTQSDLADRSRALCLRTTLTRLLELGVLPILNENDSVSVRELVEHRRAQGDSTADEVAFGDNDGLSARVAAAMDAELLVLLTDVDGLYTANPRTDPNAQRIPVLEAIDGAALARAAGSSAGGTGGMASKLEAAREVAEAGVATLIASGMRPGVLQAALRGEDVGTFVPAAPGGSRERRLRHIAIGAPRKGALIVNDGAVAALRDAKASLLPIGVIAVEGEFGRGDIVEIRDASGVVHGRGLVNYDAAACRRIAGHHSREIDDILGFRGYDAVVTRDNLALGDA